MYWDDILLVAEKVRTYGLSGHLYHIGGEKMPEVLDFSQGKETRIELLDQPFEGVDPSYRLIQFAGGSNGRQLVPEQFKKTKGTFVCLSQLEKAENPIAALQELGEVMEDGSYLILTAMFQRPYQPESLDYWRFTPDSMAMLANRAGFALIEADWHIQVENSGENVQSVYAILSKGILPPSSAETPVVLPKRKNSETALPQAVLKPELRKDSTRVAPLILPKHRCVFLNAYYPGFMENHYSKNPGLLTAPYREQLTSLQAEAFGDSNFYSRGLKRLGWEASDLIINCAPLQTAWATENNCSGDSSSILLEQLRCLQPDIVYVQDMYMMKPDLLQAIRPLTKLIVGQNAAPNEGFPFAEYDLVFSAIPYFVECYRKEGVPCYLHHLAFETRLADSVSKPFADRTCLVSFVGGLTAEHDKRYALLEALVKSTPIEFWGYGAHTLDPQSPVRERYRGEAWGLEMFRTLGNSRITLNMHITYKYKGVTNDNNAANMRLYEATGSGAMLITDYKDNLHDLFEVGKEVVAYRSVDEAVELVKYYLAHPKEAEQIAQAGQKRTLEEHSYTKRMERSAEIMARMLKYKIETGRFQEPNYQRISYGHTPIESSQITDAHRDSWKSDQMAIKQRALVQKELADMYCGKTVRVFTPLIEALKPYISNGTKFLEIGCASGYYYEIMEYLLKKKINYTGVDYSQAMIDMAKEYYPGAHFLCADGAHMPFQDREFEVVNSACVLLHCPNYAEHIAEAARVTDNILIVHRTPICKVRPTQLIKKFAYEVETVELRFHEEELIDLFESHGLSLVHADEYESDSSSDAYETTYLFQRK